MSVCLFVCLSVCLFVFPHKWKIRIFRFSGRTEKMFSPLFYTSTFFYSIFFNYPFFLPQLFFQLFWWIFLYPHFFFENHFFLPPLSFYPTPTLFLLLLFFWFLMKKYSRIYKKKLGEAERGGPSGTIFATRITHKSFFINSFMYFYNLRCLRPYMDD